MLLRLRWKLLLLLRWWFPNGWIGLSFLSYGLVDARLRWRFIFDGTEDRLGSVYEVVDLRGLFTLLLESQLHLLAPLPLQLLLLLALPVQLLLPLGLLSLQLLLVVFPLQASALLSLVSRLLFDSQLSFQFLATLTFNLHSGSGLLLLLQLQLISLELFSLELITL